MRAGMGQGVEGCGTQVDSKVTMHRCAMWQASSFFLFALGKLLKRGHLVYAVDVLACAVLKRPAHIAFNVPACTVPPALCSRCTGS